MRTRSESGSCVTIAQSDGFPDRRLFVYGTLLFPEVVEALVDRRFAMRRAILRGYRRAGIRRPAGDAVGPAIIPEASSQVEGALLEGVDDASQVVLDSFEDVAGEYDRTDVKVVLDDGSTVEAAAYVGTEEIRPLLVEGEWSPEEFRERGLRHYVSERIPRLRRIWGRGLTS